MTQDSTREALAELVACKDLKEEVQRLACAPSGNGGMERYLKAQSEYDLRQPLAWEAARAALSAPAPQVPSLDFAPHFPDCETAEPSLSGLIHCYYGFYFDKPRAAEYAKAYIAALQGATAPTKAEGASK